MNKKSQRLLEAQKLRFQQICEYNYHGAPDRYIEEAEDDDAPMEDDGMNPPGGDDMGGPDMQGGGGDMPPQDGGMGPQDGGGMPPQDGGMGGPQGGDMGAQGGGQPNTPQGFNPQGDEGGMGDELMGGEPAEGGEDMPSEDDDVIDISELIDSQEETEEETSKLGKKLNSVMKYLTQWEDLIKSNNAKIEDLKSEFEKRNPTQIEKLNMQTAKSYPFNVRPEDYWKEKEMTSNYRVGDDENGTEQEQYVITQNDIDGATDWRTIAKSLDKPLYHQSFDNTLGF